MGMPGTSGRGAWYVCVCGQAQGLLVREGRRRTSVGVLPLIVPFRVSFGGVFRYSCDGRSRGEYQSGYQYGGAHYHAHVRGCYEWRCQVWCS